MDIRLTYNLGRNDYITFALYHSRKKFVYLPTLAALLVSCLFVLVSFFSDKIYDTRVIAATAVLSGVAYDLLFYALTIHRTNRQLELNSSAPRPTGLTISGEGFRLDNEAGSGKLSYNKCHRVEETKSAFYAYISANSALLLIKEQFPSPEAVDSFRRLLAGHLEPGKLKLLK